MTIARPSRWIATALLLFPVAAFAILVGVLTLAGPAPSAQINVPYTSALTASGGVPAYTYFISSGALPNGLQLNADTGAITGTPTVAGVFTFTGLVADSASLPIDDSLAAAGRRTLAQSGRHATNASNVFTITVAGAPIAVAGAPTSMWTLCLMMAGLAGVGFFRLRQTRRT